MLTESWTQDVRERTMSQVLEVLRRRIDDPQRGIPDSVVTRQGDDRVLVQIPGEEIDRERARTLLKSTGFLEFKIVVDADASEETLRARYPDGLDPSLVVVKQVDQETGAEVGAYLVPKVADITGDYLEDARVQFDQQQRPIVEFTFSPEGGQLFEALTEKNRGKQLAIILDENVYSAPVDPGPHLDPRHDRGPLHGGRGGGSGRDPAGRLALGPGRDRGGADGRAGPRAGLDREGRPRLGHRTRRRARVRLHLLQGCPA